MKRGVTLLICLVLLGGLIGAYFYLGNNPRGKEEPDEKTEPVKLIEKQKWDIKTVKFLSKGSEIALLPVIGPSPTPRPTPEAAAEEAPSETPAPTPTPNISFTVSGFEDAVLDSTAVDNMARMAFSLEAAEKVAQSGNPEDFRLEPPEAEINAKYADGTEKTIYVGMQTPARDYYYAMIKGDPAIYMLSTSVGERAFYTIDKILSKTLPSISAETLEYVYVKQNGTEIEYAFNGTQEELEAFKEENGAVPLQMVQPYRGWELYNSNFQTHVLDGMRGISMGNLIETKPDDYSIYGLDDPSLEFWLRDAGGEMHLITGNEADESVDDDIDKTYVYVKFFDRPQVYIMDKSYLTTLYNINPFSFSPRFVALLNIDTVDEMAIRSDVDYDITLNHELVPVTATPKPTPTPSPTPDPGAPEPEQTEPAQEPESSPEPTPTPQKVIHPKVNNQEVQEGAFKTFYQTVIGLSYDTVIDTFTSTSLPGITITFMLNTGEPNVEVKFYKYNNDFYAVQRDESPIQFVIGKQYVDAVFKSAEDLLAGKLDK